MTSKTDVPRPPRTDARANARERGGTSILGRGGPGEIAKDRRIKPNEARLIHALLRGRG